MTIRINNVLLHCFDFHFVFISLRPYFVNDPFNSVL